MECGASSGAAGTLKGPAKQRGGSSCGQDSAAVLGLVGAKASLVALTGSGSSSQFSGSLLSFRKGYILECTLFELVSFYIRAQMPNPVPHFLDARVPTHLCLCCHAASVAGAPGSASFVETPAQAMDKDVSSSFEFQRTPSYLPHEAGVDF